MAIAWQTKIKNNISLAHKAIGYRLGMDNDGIKKCIRNSNIRNSLKGKETANNRKNIDIEGNHASLIFMKI